MKRQLVRGVLWLMILGTSALAQQASLVVPDAPDPSAKSSSSSGSAVTPTVTSAITEKPGFFESWRRRVHDTLKQQPAWPIPLVTPSSGLIEVLRSDFIRQISPTGTDTWVYGNSKGANLIPWYNTEFDAYVPPYIQHNSAAQDGFGDFSMLLKYRFAAGNASHGDYAISASFGGTLPTGSYKNGSLDATVLPTICAGKGFGRFDVQSSIGGTLPVADTVKLGRVVVWNSVAQYHIGRYLWPEIEDNAAFYHGGPNDGRLQNFVTPGLMFSKLKFKPDEKSPTALAFGGGMQIATSQFHAYNHALVLTVRTSF